MQTLDYVLGLHNCLEFSQPSLCLDEAMSTQEVLYCINPSCTVLVSVPTFDSICGISDKLFNVASDSTSV